VDGFWSLTMYDKDYFFVENPLNRYSISPRQDLKANADGSVDLYNQSESPGEDKESNWLPAPEDQFPSASTCPSQSTGHLSRRWRCLPCPMSSPVSQWAEERNLQGAEVRDVPRHQRKAMDVGGRRDHGYRAGGA
jgi:hypothetical protein